MDSCKEIQAMEVEALEALYVNENEFTKFSDNEFVIKVLPYPDNSEENHLSLDLRIVFGENYPNVPPQWSIENELGIDDEKLHELRGMISNVISENIESPMIYFVVQAIQDWLRIDNSLVLSMHKEKIASIKSHDDKDDFSSLYNESIAEDTVYVGLREKDLCRAEMRVSEVEFHEWSEKFRQEMQFKGIWKTKDETTGILTGKQLFLQNSLSVLNDEYEEYD